MKRKRNGVWFWVLMVVFVISGYAIVTYAVAGSENACNGGGGSIEFSTKTMPPKFICDTGLIGV